LSWQLRHRDCAVGYCVDALASGGQLVLQAAHLRSAALAAGQVLLSCCGRFVCDGGLEQRLGRQAF
jgi:hypothetical protein